MNDTTPDPEITSALNSLPDAPAHGLGFWDTLETSMSATAPEATNVIPFHRRRPVRYGLAAAAALVVFAGTAVGLGAFDDRQTLEDAADASTTTVAASGSEASTTTTSPPVTGAPTTTAALSIPPSVALSQVEFRERAASELFHYDVGIPPGFEVIRADGRGVFATSSAANLELRNARIGDQDRVFSPTLEGEQVVSERTVTVPLYESGGGVFYDNGVILEVRETVLAGGFTQNRIVRTYSFNDRVVVAELSYPNESTVDPIVILDDIRMFNAALAPFTDCSTLGRAPLEPPAALNAAQTATFNAIGGALSTCDWDALDNLTSDDFTASFGGGEAIELWMDSESYGETILATLYDHLAVTPAIEGDGAAWPRAFTRPWEDVTDEMKQELIDLGYDESGFELYAEIGYFGYRTGIATDGQWQYFVAGD